MSMEKVGVSKEILYTGLRDQEAKLMQKMQSAMFDGEKTADDKSAIEVELQEVRRKLTELDLQNS